MESIYTHDIDQKEFPIGCCNEFGYTGVGRLVVVQTFFYRRFPFSFRNSKRQKIR
jgi:hypothetical protein